MRADTLARARGLKRPELAYVARIPVSDGHVDHEYTWAEIVRDAQWLADRLRDLGLHTGHWALLTFSGHEGPWLRPLIDAVRSLSVRYATAESSGWDHNRTAMFARKLRPEAVIGLSQETLQGLSGQTMVGDLFADTPIVLARPDAATSLRGAGVPAGVLAFLGPALAIECRERDGVHLDPAEWTVADDTGELTLTPAEHRAKGMGTLRLGLRGRVLGQRCACGAPGQRVILG